MLISSKGRYALRIMLDLAQNSDGQYIPLKDMTVRQNISQKYLESIMVMLSKNGLVEAMHGKGGGYRLGKSPEEYKVGDILRLTEGTLAPVMCLEENAKSCERAVECQTLPLWAGLNKVITEYLDGISLEDIIQRSEKLNYDTTGINNNTR